MAHRTHTQAERESRRAQERELIRAAVEQLRSSEGWQRWLRARSSFHAYSLRNQLLIAHQHESAQRVAGFKAWLELGYCVRRGRARFASARPARRARMPSSAGSPRALIPRSARRRPSAWRASSPRTRSRRCPRRPARRRSIRRSHRSTVRSHRAHRSPHRPGGDTRPHRLDHLARRPERPVRFGRRRDLDQDIARRHALVATLIHELAHVLVRFDHEEEDPKLTYAQEELVVESVAFSVCGVLGLDTSANSIPYLVAWSVRRTSSRCSSGPRPS